MKPRVLAGRSRAVPTRLVVTVCPRESGVVTLPVERGEHVVRLDAAAILKALRALVDARGLTDRVRLCEGCAGGCSADGPNVSVEIFPAPLPGERPDHVAIGWKTYVYSLPTLACLATVIEVARRDFRAVAGVRTPARARAVARAARAAGVKVKSVILDVTAFLQ